MKRNFVLKLLLCIALVCITAFFFTACGGDNSDNNNAGNNQNQNQNQDSGNTNGGNDQNDNNNAGNNQNQDQNESNNDSQDGVVADVTIDGLKYHIENGTATVSGVENNTTITNVTIPEKINYNEKSYAVISIGGGAFSDCLSLTSVEIPDGVTSIGYYAFYGCNKLQYNEKDGLKYLGNENNKYLYLAGVISSEITNVTIDENCKIIDSGAFLGCTSLQYNEKDGLKYLGNENNKYLYLLGVISSEITTATIDENCKIIGSSAFFYCTSLTNIIVDEDNANYKSIDGNLYSKDGNTLIQYAMGKTATEFTIPNGVTSIGDSAFYGCRSLTSVEIPDGVTSIGDYAFLFCTSLTSILIPDSVTSIGGYAFGECNKLQYNEKDGLKYLGNENNKYLYLAGVISSEITNVTIDENCRFIDYFAFYNCTSLISVVIGDSVASIGEGAFYNCTSLTCIIVDEDNANYKSIDGNLYSKDGKTLIQYAVGKTATEFTIPNGVTSIGDSAFYNCTSLTSIVIGDGVTSIGDSAFYNCTSLTSIDIPDSVTSIGDSAFYGCTSLTSVEIPDSVTSIGNSAFSSCTSLQYNEKDGLKYLGNENNKYLYLLGVVSTGITTATIDENCRFIGDDMFYNCALLISVVIGDSVTSIGSNTFFCCISLTSVVIGENVTSICDYAFYHCISLTSISFNGTVEEWDAIEKGSGWDYNVPATKVICTDGEVDI